MPWGAPIGSGLGLVNPYGLRALRARFPGVPLVIDAGLGLPSQAAAAMEMGYDAVLLNTAVAKAGDPVAMARAFARALEAGALARAADPMEPRDMAEASTPEIGRAFPRMMRDRDAAEGEGAAVMVNWLTPQHPLIRIRRVGSRGKRRLPAGLTAAAGGAVAR